MGNFYRVNVKIQDSFWLKPLISFRADAAPKTDACQALLQLLQMVLLSSLDTVTCVVRLPACNLHNLLYLPHRLLPQIRA